MHTSADTQRQPTSEVSTVPSDINSPRAKLVYLFLSTHGETDIPEMQSALDMKKISLYSILSTLCERDLIDQDNESYCLCPSR